MRYHDEPPPDLHGMWITALAILLTVIGSILASVYL